jgi:predicted DsbA family dithiol-disulfide isomerase
MATGIGTNMQIEIWTDLVCPWCYLGKRNLEQALDSLTFRDDVSVWFRSFEVLRDAPRGVTTSNTERVAKTRGWTRSEAEHGLRQMEQRAAAAGLTFRMSELRSGNSHDAHRLMQFATQKGLQAEAVEALHRAYFTEQRSIFSSESLLEIAVEIGLDRVESAVVLGTDAYTAEVAADQRLAASFGISGVPFFVVDRMYASSGAQPAAAIADVLRKVHEQSAA